MTRALDMRVCKPIGLTILIRLTLPLGPLQHYNRVGRGINPFKRT